MEITKLRKISGFSEISFDMHGHRQGHMDMGAVPGISP